LHRFSKRFASGKIVGRQEWTEEDASSIGISAVLKVSTIREWLLSWKISAQYIPGDRGPPKAEIVVEIRKAFSLDGEQ